MNGTSSRIWAALALAVVACISGLGAAEPASTAFNYQARIVHGGAELDAPADFRFTLWDAREDGLMIGEPIELGAHDVIGGVLTARLDFGLRSFADGEARWLQIEVRAPAGTGDFETLRPRQALDAVPHALHALSGTPGPAGPPGPEGPPGDSIVAGQLCPAGESAIGFNVDGTLLCASLNACSGVNCQPHQNCELRPGPGGQEVPICVDTCNGFSCPDGLECELREVSCITAPCPPVATCTMMPGNPDDPCAGVQCQTGQECKVFDDGNERTGYCADTCEGRQCDANQVCVLEPVTCVRAPCPPIAQCIPRDPCDGVTCDRDQACQVFTAGDGSRSAYCADVCDAVQCPRDQHCELVDVSCITEPCPPIAQCVPDAQGDTCELQLDQGPCRARIPRWGFNSDSGLCERFFWGGCGGNGNNYETRAACEQGCGGRDACTLPADDGPCNASLPRWFHNDAKDQCERFFYGGCGGNDNNFHSQGACEAACQPDRNDQCEAAANPGPCRAAIPRWSHDAATGQCEQFIWGGCGGNDNNYPTREACERTCEVDVDICARPVDPGPCRAAIPQWTHNPQTGQCEKFVYGGCGGNENRFSTRAECEGACDVQVDVCAQPEDPGPCRAYLRRWHHDSASGLCRPFIYGGCGGNDNNFDTQTECRDACGATVDLCDLPADVGPCDAAIPRWFHDANTDQCQQFSYGGCEGNANNFTTRAESEQSCDVAQPDVCELPVEPGPCQAAIPRWFNNPATGMCERFIYGGCGGNDNNFTGLQACEQACRPASGGD